MAKAGWVDLVVLGLEFRVRGVGFRVWGVRFMWEEVVQDNCRTLEEGVDLRNGLRM